MILKVVENSILHIDMWKFYFLVNSTWILTYYILRHTYYIIRKVIIKWNIYLNNFFRFEIN